MPVPPAFPPSRPRSTTAPAPARAAARCSPLPRRRWHSRRDQPRPPGPVVPRDDPVIETQHHVGDVEIGVARAGQALEHAAPVVPDVACRATLERREAGHGRGLVGGQEPADSLQGISFDRRPWSATDRLLGHRRGAPDPGPGIGSQEGELSEMILVGGAVEPEQPGEAEQAPPRRLRRGGWQQFEHGGRRGHSPGQAGLRRGARPEDRWVSLTCSRRVSSAGVR